MCKSFFKSLFTSALNPCYFMPAHSLKLVNNTNISFSAACQAAVYEVQAT